MTTLVHPGDSLTRGRRLTYILVLGALAALGPFTIDLYLPAFPILTKEFDVSDAAVQWSLSATMLGFAVGQLIIGPWSDKVGRKMPLIIATAVHVVASVLAAMSPDIFLFAVFRTLQGFGAAAGAVVAMAAVRDLFSGHPLVRMLSRMALISGLAPILAPVIGSQLLLVLDWRGLFWVLGIYSALVLIAVIFFIVETLPPSQRHDPGHSTLRERYGTLFRDRIFVGVAIIGGMNFAGLFAYLQASSLLFQEQYGLSPQQYGLLFGVNSIGVMIGVQTSSRLSRRIPPQWILAVSTAIMLIAALAIVVLSATGAGLWGILVPLFVFILATGAGFPMVQVLALMHHGHEAGTAASLLGASNFGVAGLLSPIVGLLGISAASMGGVMAAAAGVSILSLWFIVRPRSVPALLS